jgi:hypothetical protein
MVTVLTRCGLPLPTYVLAEEKHSHCLTANGYLPTIVCGRMIWRLGSTTEASAAALTHSSEVLQRAAAQQEPSYRGQGVRMEGFDSTAKSRRTLGPRACLGHCLRHAIQKLPGNLTAITSGVRQTLHAQFHTLLYRARQRQGVRGLALGQRLRRLADHGATTAGTANGQRVRQWFHDKQAGWYAVRADPPMPVTSTWLDPAHNPSERQLCAMQGFQHPGGSRQAFLTGLAHLYHLGPLSAAPRMPAKVGWRWKAVQSRPTIGGSISKSARLEACSELLRRSTTRIAALAMLTVRGLLVYSVIPRQVRLDRRTHAQQIPGNKGITATPTAAGVLALLAQVALV